MLAFIHGIKVLIYIAGAIGLALKGDMTHAVFMIGAAVVWSGLGALHVYAHASN